MAVKSKIIVFIVIVGICLLAQSFDTYTGINSDKEKVAAIDHLID